MLPDGLRRLAPRLLVTHTDPAKSAPKPAARSTARGSSAKAHSTAHGKSSVAHTAADQKKRRVTTTFRGVDARSTFAQGDFEKSAAWKKFNGQVDGDGAGASGELNVLHAV